MGCSPSTVSPESKSVARELSRSSLPRNPTKKEERPPSALSRNTGIVGGGTAELQPSQKEENVIGNHAQSIHR